MLTKARGFAAVTVLTLALGTAASTVMFSVLNAVVLQPLPYRDPDKLVLLWIDDVKRQLHQTLVPYPLYMDWKERSKAFSELGFSTANAPITLSGMGVAERLDAVRAMASTFAVLGVSPIEDRSYSLREELSGENVWLARQLLLTLPGNRRSANQWIVASSGSGHMSRHWISSASPANTVAMMLNDRD